jgi:glutamine amidotransferase
VDVLKNINDGDHVYFVHSYYPVPADPQIVATTTDYGFEFASSVHRGNLYACQFHPEKSQKVGLAILEAFWKKVKEREEKL